jgi:hypothetical protein
MLFSNPGGSGINSGAASLQAGVACAVAAAGLWPEPCFVQMEQNHRGFG